MIELSGNIIISEESYKKAVMAMSEIVDEMATISDQAKVKNVETELPFAFSNFYGNILREGTLESMRKCGADSEEAREMITNLSNKIMMGIWDALK